MPTEPYRTSIEIDAPPAVVFPYLTQADLILRWIGQYAVADPRPGGEFTLDVNGVPVRGRYLKLDPPHSVTIAWGLAGSDLLPPGASTVEVRLRPTHRGTLLELEHRDLPTEEAAKHAVGWPVFVGRLADVLEGRSPKPDPFAIAPPG